MFLADMEVGGFGGLDPIIRADGSVSFTLQIAIAENRRNHLKRGVSGETRDLDRRLRPSRKQPTTSILSRDPTVLKRSERPR